MSDNKCDAKLGLAVHEHLKNLGCETPMWHNGLSSAEKKTKLAEAFKTIMETLGLDLSDDSLIETPNRVAKMYVQEIFAGLDIEAFPKCTTVQNKMSYDEVICERNISVESNCEHHFVVLSGVAHVAYIPKDKVLGLSKLNRVVRYFCKRPQIQERITEQIFHALCFILGTDNVAVMIDAQHFCVKSRGIEDVNSRTSTSKLGGTFKKNPSARQEFFSIVHSKN